MILSDPGLAGCASMDANWLQVRPSEHTSSNDLSEQRGSGPFTGFACYQRSRLRMKNTVMTTMAQKMGFWYQCSLSSLGMGVAP